MKKIVYYLPSIIFNVAELAIIALIGMLLGLSLKDMLIIFIPFAFIRISLGNAMHYKAWYKCMIWSCLVFLSLFVLAKAGLILSIIMAIFCGYILTSKGNINDTFEWKGKESKNQDIVDFIKYNEYDDKLIEFEKKLKEKESLSFLIYKYRFKEGMTFSEISEKLDGLDNPRIAETLDKIAFSIRIYCGI